MRWSSATVFCTASGKASCLSGGATSAAPTGPEPGGGSQAARPIAAGPTAARMTMTARISPCAPIRSPTRAQALREERSAQGGARGIFALGILARNARGAGQLLVERLTIAGAAAHELRPVGHLWLGIGLL